MVSFCPGRLGSSGKAHVWGRLAKAIAEGLAYKIATSDVPEMLVGPRAY